MELYTYDIGTFNQYYTGTDLQPDALQIFFKGNKDSFSHITTAEPKANLFGRMVPIFSVFAGMARASQAIKRIFEELKQAKFKANDPHLREVGNGFKNLGLAVLEMTPLTGLALIIFAEIRNTGYFGSKVLKATKDEGNIAGVAIDGKVVFKVSLGQVPQILNSLGYFKDQNNVVDQDVDRNFERFKHFCLESLKGYGEKEKNDPQVKNMIGVRAVFEKLQAHELKKIGKIEAL